VKYLCNDPPPMTQYYLFLASSNPPPMTQYYLFLASSNQTFQEVTHPGITLTEARLTAEF